MDYKYIEQLLERYWACETSLEEEHILRTFFAQKELPVQLQKYRHLFEYEQCQKQQKLGEDFDRRLLEIVGEEPKVKKEVVIKAHRLTLNYRLRPLYRAAAVVAVFLMVGGAVQHTFNRQNYPAGWDYNMANYQDTYMAPQEAFEASMGGIEEIQNLLRDVPSPTDSLNERLQQPNDTRQ